MMLRVMLVRLRQLLRIMQIAQYQLLLVHMLQKGVEASGLRKEIAAAEAAAKSHADSVAATAKSEAISEAGTAASGLLDAYKTEGR